MKNTVKLVAILSLISLTTGCGLSSDLSVSDRKEIIRTMEQETLARLYEEEANTKKKIKKASGYAVFSNANINLIFVSAGTGYGVVVDNATGKRTYMKMGLGGVGLGLGPIGWAEQFEIG